MDPTNFVYTDAELQDAGLLGEDVPPIVTQTLATMRSRPDLLNLSIFALRCMVVVARRERRPESAEESPALFFTSDTTVVSQYTPTDYERIKYYNGITGDDDHPELVYRSDFHTTTFPAPDAQIPVKSLRGVYDTLLNGVWETVGPKIVDLITTRKINWSSVDPARFFTHATPGEEKGSLGPVVIWIGVIPGSTSSDTAHEVSQEILTLLREHGVNDTVVEWRGAVLRRLAGPALMRHVDNTDPTHHVRRCFTALLGIPFATQGMNTEDTQGTLTLWFHENNGKDDNKVYGVSNCHVLRRNTTVDYKHKGGAPKYFVRVCGLRRFQRAINEIKEHISAHAIRADGYTQALSRLEAMDNQDEVVSEIDAKRRKLNDEKEAIRQLQALYDEVAKYWVDIDLHRGIGYVQYAAAIKVDVEGGTKYTSDWGVFLAAEAKVKAQFEGNVVDLGSKYSPEDLTEMLYPWAGGATTFKFPEGRKLRIVGCATKEELANPDSKGDRGIIVGKDGNTTGLTFGHYAGLMSFTRNPVGIVSVELGIYNSGLKNAEVFSAMGDSGSLVWRMKDGKAYIFGQLHSGENKGRFTSNHITYCTPGWYLLAQIKKQYPQADFYRTTW